MQCKYLPEFFVFEDGVDFGAVEADDDLAIEIDDEDTGLAGFVHGFLGVGRVGLDIFLDVLDALFVQIFFGGVTKGAPVGAIDRDGNVTHIHSIALSERAM